MTFLPLRLPSSPRGQPSHPSSTTHSCWVRDSFFGPHKTLQLFSLYHICSVFQGSPSMTQSQPLKAVSRSLPRKCVITSQFPYQLSQHHQRSWSFHQALEGMMWSPEAQLRRSVNGLLPLQNASNRISD